MNTIYIIIRTIKGSNYSKFLGLINKTKNKKAKAELKLLRKGDIIYDYKLKEYQEVEKSKRKYNENRKWNYRSYKYTYV